MTRPSFGFEGTGMAFALDAVGAIRDLTPSLAHHAAGPTISVPAEMIVFRKTTVDIWGSNDPITIPGGSHTADWDVKLDAVIDQRARDVIEAEDLVHGAAYRFDDDGSDFAFQTERSGDWSKSTVRDSSGGKRQEVAQNV